MKFSSKGKSEVEDGSDIEHILTHMKLKLKNKQTNKTSIYQPLPKKGKMLNTKENSSGKGNIMPPRNLNL